MKFVRLTDVSRNVFLAQVTSPAYSEVRLKSDAPFHHHSKYEDDDDEAT